MFLAQDEFGSQVFAHQAVKNESYFCPVCEAPVRLKAGKVKVAHFSHQHILQCTRYLYKKESLMHLKLKHDIYTELNKIYPAAMEYYLREIEQIPDVLVNDQLAIEIQLSRISADLVAIRTKGYNKLGMKVIWLINDAELKKDECLLSLNHFQYATTIDHKLFTINTESLSVNIYHIGHHVGNNRFLYRCVQIQIKDLYGYSKSVDWPSDYKLSQNMVKNILYREKSAKSVLNPTLTYLYQLDIHHQRIPNRFIMTCLDERDILNSPLEWKLYIHYHLNRGTFNLQIFMDFIKLRTNGNILEKHIIVKNLVRYYLKVFRDSEDIA